MPAFRRRLCSSSRRAWSPPWWPALHVGSLWLAQRCALQPAGQELKLRRRALAGVRELVRIDCLAHCALWLWATARSTEVPQFLSGRVPDPLTCGMAHMPQVQSSRSSRGGIDDAFTAQHPPADVRAASPSRGLGDARRAAHARAPTHQHSSARWRGARFTTCSCCSSPRPSSVSESAARASSFAARRAQQVPVAERTGDCHWHHDDACTQTPARPWPPTLSQRRPPSCCRGRPTWSWPCSWPACWRPCAGCGAWAWRTGTRRRPPSACWTGQPVAASLLWRDGAATPCRGRAGSGRCCRSRCATARTRRWC